MHRLKPRLNTQVDELNVLIHPIEHAILLTIAESSKIQTRCSTFLLYLSSEEPEQRKRAEIF